jgi:hypothetical protein
VDDPGDLTEPVAVSTRVCSDSREDTSTVAVLTSNPALLNTKAATSALPWCRSANRTRLPALTRRAIA